MHPTRPNTPAIDSTGQNTLNAWISRDSDYCITKYKPNLVKTCAHGNFRHYKSACKHACIQRIQTKLRYKTGPSRGDLNWGGVEGEIAE